MNTPRLSLLVTALPRLFAAALAALSLSQCTHSDPKPVADKAALRTEWYIASQYPLTYCPKGHVLPAAKRFEQATFVYLPNRRTRFYIPPKDERHKQQALTWRASAPPAPEALRDDRLSAKQVAQGVAVSLICLPLSPFIYLLTGGEHISPIEDF
jgi:hypothetical protein